MFWLFVYLSDFHFLCFEFFFCCTSVCHCLIQITPTLFSYDFFHFSFKGINWCFVSYSFVSVKGPGRKLSLPTDLKTDLGTVGESQQFSHDFFESFSFCFYLGFYVALVVFILTQICHCLLLFNQSTRLSDCLSILPLKVF